MRIIQSLDRKAYRENERLIGDKEKEKSTSYRRQLLVGFIASLMSFSSGTVIAGWTPIDKSHEDDELHPLSNEQDSWIISIYVFGALLGALPAGHLSQKYGRKSFLLWLALPMVFGWVICILTLNNVLFECLGRSICGLSLGATTVAVPLYAVDVSSDALRGRTGVLLDFMLCAGILYAYVVRTLLTGLRPFCLAAIAVPLVFVAAFWSAPESPAHLFKNGRFEEAASALRWLRGSQFDVKSEFKKLERSQWKGKDALESGEKTFTVKNKKVLVKVLFVSFGLVLAQRLSGVGGVIQYTVTLFRLSGSTLNANTSCIIFGTCQLVASASSFLFIDKVGRRTLLLLSSAIVTMSLVFLTVYFINYENGTMAIGSAWKTCMLFVLCAMIAAFRLGLGPIPWFMIPELAPSEYNGRIESVTASFSWFLSFFIMKTFKMFIENYPIALWFSFAACSAVGFVFILFYVPETNNKSREQIYDDLTK